LIIWVYNGDSSSSGTLYGHESFSRFFWINLENKTNSTNPFMYHSLLKNPLSQLEELLIQFDKK